MTVPPESKTDQPLPPPPPRLAFITVPLLIALFYNAFSLLTLPFAAPSLNDMLDMLSRDGVTTGTPVQLAPEQITLVLWIAFALTAALILWLYFTRRAVLEGRAWGRVSAIVLAVLSLLALPFGPILGIIMLIGAFDKQVQAYTVR
ncbi:hypothetical protein GCM10008959_10740 [Deinococcus seoulensis]|uniref:Uncharacterized protein n=1 Tax=Deinococcus seoulensis TaxID=1837379 RepID=A0ABQ2RN38_9DEIO|nr:hypothetical protein [Deinococcus seoulensis]GGR51353.1 hypothetical protein GCM10008959_10740 [Deinococcus seoulensis]